MTLTSHGHHIKDSPQDTGDLPPQAKCGGPGLCGLCSSQATEWWQANRRQQAIDEIRKLDPQHEGILVPLKFQSIVVDVEAVQFTGGASSGMDIERWINSNGGNATWQNAAEPWVSPTDPKVGHDGWPEALKLQTPTGFVEVTVGSWILHGTEGEFYNIAEDVFPKKYEEIYG